MNFFKLVKNIFFIISFLIFQYVDQLLSDPALVWNLGIVFTIQAWSE